MIRRSLLACVALSAIAMAVQAQDTYPSKPIKFVVGYSPGGSNDILARIVAKRLGDSLGQPVVVENRPSTGAIVGAVVTKQAAPDGYTLMIGASGPLVINAATYANLPYSPQKDFIPISTIATFPLIVSVKADSPFKSMPDLVKYTKENPQLSNYASSASTFQLATELLKERTGIQSQHVPYKGSGDSMKSVAGGETTFSMLDPGPAAGAINGKLVRGLAVSSDVRNPSFPDIPTLKEQGIDLSIQFWIGLFAPAGTPAPIVKLLEREVPRRCSTRRRSRAWPSWA
ncbi:Bug family tripartite tricarboxylate transporter substrate binding protein [Hydrogenophaga sp. UC242_53]|uniref:Bug family tripartite tricarboxylate transporter substrate binding protein n=1 Tax=Hydrogenophaga sp. UC242_53 TaxID=3350170 RepID=UPI0036D37E8F